jgi:EAL domain-containing protein (putative c-di-GMP-specific phosphodiesterase class I)
MATNLKLDVVAEGVENQQQLDFLRANGCDIVQGHLFGDPMSATEFRDLLVAEAEGEGSYRALFA